MIAVGGEHVANLSEFHEALAKYDLEEGVRLRLKTEGMQRFIFLKK